MSNLDDLMQSAVDRDFAKIAAAFAAEHPEPPAETVGEAAERGMREAAAELARKWAAEDERLAESRAAGREAHERAQAARGQAAGRGQAAVAALPASRSRVRVLL